MARERSPNRDKAKEMYLFAKGEIKLTDIAAHLKVSDSQIRKWKSSDKWDLELNGALPMSNSNVTNKKGAKKEHIKKKKEPIAKEVEEVVESDGLTEKQRLFCLYYIKTYNATRSYQKAYNCSYEVALCNGPRLLKNARVKSEVDELKKVRMNEDFMEASDVVRKYQEIAFTDDPILDSSEVKMADKLKALDFLAKYYKLLESESDTQENKLDSYLEKVRGVFET